MAYFQIWSSAPEFADIVLLEYALCLVLAPVPRTASGRLPTSNVGRHTWRHGMENIN